MAVYQYAERFTQMLQQKYAKECCSHDLTLSNQNVQFLNAQTIKLPRMTMSGYKDHTRTIGFNAGTMSNDWEPKKLEHDRDIEYWIDPMDIDETNLTLSVANIQNTFEKEQAIPEKDSYRFSKLHTEAVSFNKGILSGTLDEHTFLEIFDEMMCRMDEAAVPEEGRLIYTTPSTYKVIKNAEGIQRTLTVNTSNGINRQVHSLDDITLKRVPSSRMKTRYDFTDGCVVDPAAKQINFIMMHPSCVVCKEKHAYIKLFTPGHDSRTGDGYLYQNRYYEDLFLLERKIDGVEMHVSA